MLSFIFDYFEATWLAKNLKKTWLIFLVCLPLAIINSILCQALLVLTWEALSVDYSPAEIISRVVVGGFFVHPLFILVIFYIVRMRELRKKIKITDISKEV